MVRASGAKIPKTTGQGITRGLSKKGYDLSMSAGGPRVSTKNAGSGGSQRDYAKARKRGAKTERLVDDPPEYLGIGELAELAGATPQRSSVSGRPAKKEKLK